VRVFKSQEASEPLRIWCSFLLYSSKIFVNSGLAISKHVYPFEFL